MIRQIITQTAACIGDSPVYLKGLRFDAAELNWPWHQKAILPFHGREGDRVQTVRFDRGDLPPARDMDASVTILDGSGSTVSGELIRDGLEKNN